MHPQPRTLPLEHARRTLELFELQQLTGRFAIIYSAFGCGLYTTLSKSL